MSKRVRVRFAPSPTGPLHIGGVRTALFNYLFAKKHGGDFLLRIEDTDSKREVSGSMGYIFDSLHWLGIMPDESPWSEGKYGPYTQSHRSHIYKEYVDKLIESGHAYYAFDTTEELDKMREDLKAAGFSNAGYAGVVRDRMRNSLTMPASDSKAKIDAGEPYVVRFKMPRNEEVKFEDKIRGWVVFNTNSLDDKVIWKSSDGLPTYHLANVVDDYLMEITHVIRGEEWVSSTPLHILLYNAFGWEHPEFAHLPLILAPNGKKLGKRDGDKYGIPVFPLDWDYRDADGNDVHISGFREAGYEPDALINFMALLGWNPGNNIEHMSLDEMINLFSLERVNNAGAMFDKDKLDNFNAHYLRSKNSDYILSKMNMPEEFVSGLSKDKLEMISKMATERVIFAKDLSGAMDYLYTKPNLDGELNIKNVDEFIRIIEIFISDEILGSHNDHEWTSEHIRMELESIAANINVKIGKVMPMLRLALTGGAPGPQLPEIMYIIGPVETKNRITNLINKIKELA